MPEYLAPGVYVEETSFRPKSIEGVSTSTTAFVGPTRKGPLSGTPEVMTSFGEFTRMYGGLSNLSFASGTDAAPEMTNYLAHAVRSFFENGGARVYIARTFQPRIDAAGTVTSAGFGQSAQFVTTAGGFTAQFRSREPGSGYNGEIRVSERLSPANVATMAAAPDGSLLRIGGEVIARSATLRGITGPTFFLTHNDQLTLTATGVDVTIQFQGTSAVVTGTALAEPVTVPDDTTLVVTVDSMEQTINLPAGDQSIAALVDAINRSIRYGRAWIENGNQISLGTDRRGTSAVLAVQANDLLGFAGGANSNGGGNVADLEHVTIAELQALLETARPNTLRVTMPPSTGQLTFATVATGTAATLQAQDTPGRTALGLPSAVATGENGANPSYFLKTNGSWAFVGGVNIPAPDTSQPLTTTAHLVSVNLETEDGDGNLMAYENLGFATTHPRYIGAILPQRPSRKADALQNLYWLQTSGTNEPFALFNGLLGGGTENTIPVAGGNDGGTPVSSSMTAGAVSYERGLEVLEIIEDISIIAAPGSSGFDPNDTADILYRDVQNRLISHAERMKYRIAVLDTKPGLTVGEVREARGLIDSTYAAVYFPWITIANPLARPGNDLIPKEINIPPSGAMSGIYARTDVQRGVWKAPANEVVRDALRFEVDVNKRQQDVLNPEGINCLRYLSGRGYRVWGARTATSDLEWLYVSVRRYFIYLERSIDVSTQWAVFEPNGPDLWANIRETVSNFLYAEWLTGALLGASREEAFFVRCDRSTMTQQDLDLGRLICEIGVAVVKPAEFVIFRIGQKTADARG